MAGAVSEEGRGRRGAREGTEADRAGPCGSQGGLGLLSRGR